MTLARIGNTSGSGCAGVCGCFASSRRAAAFQAGGGAPKRAMDFGKILEEAPRCSAHHEQWADISQAPPDTWWDPLALRIAGPGTLEHPTASART